jgi:signal transduction histidine kinase
MKLSTFIQTHLEEILAEWDSFAGTFFPVATAMSTLALRDHAKQILQELALDIETEQTSKQQSEKSKGLAPREPGTDSAASTHGTERQDSGFTLVQVTAEFRALRATVLRLWLQKIAPVTDETTLELVRFNEAIDQALAESVATYSEQAARTRDIFLAILGHDLRSPLAVMAMAGSFLTDTEEATTVTRQVAGWIAGSTATMTLMVNDLLEYGRTQLGGAIPVAPQLADLRGICEGALDAARAAHPDCVFELQASGDLVAILDSARLQQVFANLLNNAAQYRAPQHPVILVAQGGPDALTVEVQNFGFVIPSKSLQKIFDPLVQLSVKRQQKGPPSTSLGLGLFIAREITMAHGGTIAVQSSKRSGTVFTVRLPRSA